MSRSDGMWDEEDGFYHDILRLPDGSATRKFVPACVFAIIVVSFPNRCRFPVRQQTLLDSAREKESVWRSIPQECFGYP